MLWCHLCQNTPVHTWDKNVSLAHQHLRGSSDDSCAFLSDGTICYRDRSHRSTAILRPLCMFVCAQASTCACVCVPLVIKWLKSRFVLRFRREHRHYVHQLTSIYLCMCASEDVCGRHSIVTAWCSLQCACVHIRHFLCCVSTALLCECSCTFWKTLLGKSLFFSTVCSLDR